MKASTSSRTGPIALRTTCQRRSGSPPRGVIVSSEAELQLELHRGARLERYPEAGAGGLLDRAVRAERQHGRRRCRGTPGTPRTSVRVPEPGSRSSHGRDSSSSIATQRRRASGSPGRRDQHELVVGEVHTVEAVVVRDAPRDRHVHLVVEHALEHDLAVPHVERDLHLGPALAEGLDQLRHEVLPRGRHGADAQRVRPRLLRLARRPRSLRQQPEHVARVGRIRLTRRRRPHGPARPAR